MRNIRSLTPDPDKLAVMVRERSRSRIGVIARSLCGSVAVLLCDVRAEDTTVQTSLSGVSLEELMNVHVTSVSRGESTIGESPAAIFVVTPEMIRRSGATNIPEILRMV